MRRRVRVAGRMRSKQNIMRTHDRSTSRNCDTAVDAMPQPLKVVPVEDSFGSKASCTDVQCERLWHARIVTSQKPKHGHAPRGRLQSVALCALRHAAIEQASRSHASATPLAANQRLRAGRRTCSQNGGRATAERTKRQRAWQRPRCRLVRSDNEATTKQHQATPLSMFFFFTQNVQFWVRLPKGASIPSLLPPFVGLALPGSARGSQYTVHSRVL